MTPHFPAYLLRRRVFFQSESNPFDERRVSPIMRRELLRDVCVHLRNFAPQFSFSRKRSFVVGDTDVGGDGGGGGKYIMPLVKLSFYDHFMVARGPSMLSTYRCVLLTAELGARADTSRISFIIRVSRTL